MKRISILILCLLSISIISCKKEKVEPTPPLQQPPIEYQWKMENFVLGEWETVQGWKATGGSSYTTLSSINGYVWSINEETFDNSPYTLVEQTFYVDRGDSDYQLYNIIQYDTVINRMTLEKEDPITGDKLKYLIQK